MVFTSTRSGNRHLWTARTDGSDARPLTSGPSLDDHPAFSPDGQQIAFVSDRGGRRAIWTINPAGGAPRKLADVDALDGTLTWSFDGSQIVYAAGAGDFPGLFPSTSRPQVTRLAFIDRTGKQMGGDWPFSASQQAPHRRSGSSIRRTRNLIPC